MCLQDMKRVLGDGYFIRAKIASKMLAKADLQCAFDFVELQMLLPRRQCIETQVALPRLACPRVFPDPLPDRECCKALAFCDSGVFADLQLSTFKIKYHIKTKPPQATAMGSFWFGNLGSSPQRLRGPCDSTARVL